MSAFIVSNASINQIINYLNVKNKTHEGISFDGYYLDQLDDLIRLGNDMFKLNAEAVGDRYRHDPVAPVFQHSYLGRKTLDSVGIYKSLQCLIYQCNEGNIPDLPLFKALEDALARVANNIISELPAYKAKGWGE